MPLARIDMIKGNTPEFRQVIGDVVYQAMVDILKAPASDRFQVIGEHDASDFIFDPEFLGIHRSPGYIFIQLTLVAGRSLEQKRGFYRTDPLCTIPENGVPSVCFRVLDSGSAIHDDSLT